MTTFILATNSSEYEKVKSNFSSRMNSQMHSIHSIIRVEMPQHIVNNHEKYKKNNPNLQFRQFFHGTKHACSIKNLNTLCNNSTCFVCSIIQASYSHTFTRIGNDSSRAMFLVDVVGASPSSGSEFHVANAE
ncbi:10237_t:CDS:2, partial [Scutellospora calospora]